MGMCFATALSRQLKQLPSEDAERINDLLARCGLPLKPDRAGFPGGWAALRKAITSDKKTQKRVPRFVLAENIGSVIYGCELAEEVLEATYTELFG